VIRLSDGCAEYVGDLSAPRESVIRVSDDVERMWAIFPHRASL
jgi:hypothetical protein